MHFFIKFILNVRGILAQKIYNIHAIFRQFSDVLNTGNPNNQASSVSWLPVNPNALKCRIYKKEQQEIKFYKKSLDEFIFSCGTKNLNLFYFTRMRG